MLSLSPRGSFTHPGARQLMYCIIDSFTQSKDRASSFNKNLFIVLNISLFDIIGSCWLMRTHVGNAGSLFRQMMWKAVSRLYCNYLRMCRRYSFIILFKCVSRNASCEITLHFVINFADRIPSLILTASFAFQYIHVSCVKCVARVQAVQAWVLVERFLSFSWWRRSNIKSGNCVVQLRMATGVQIWIRGHHV